MGTQPTEVPREDGAHVLCLLLGLQIAKIEDELLQGARDWVHSVHE